MRVQFLGSESGQTGCPTVYKTDRDTYLVQGWVVTDEEALAELHKHGNGIPAHETVVEIPEALVRFFQEQS
ncbi:hypothetical protein ORV05_05090 [Amycolatopsis cynarae]|uniref:Uncharacterized protein n=1 Tax=Amycolatopsis cynarae TaxID=2995223 RepID=A0ABY7B7K4_9PSEU|nr:hypothetical protein [Amycolatopsis sp. HUAS 11-8]WAL67168.1 hypothetical protein ORV05_05090 [Amycolatopsis sp. HUAS 11-8]